MYSLILIIVFVWLAYPLFLNPIIICLLTYIISSLTLVKLELLRQNNKFALYIVTVLQHTVSGQINNFPSGKCFIIVSQRHNRTIDTQTTILVYIIPTTTKQNRFTTRHVMLPKIARNRHMCDVDHSTVSPTEIAQPRITEIMITLL